MQAIQEAYATGVGGTMLVAALLVALLLVISLLLLVIGALQNQVSHSAGAGATPSSPGPDGG